MASTKERTFGSAISDKRKELMISQKELALKILKEDGNPIAPQYLNDIEHDRRNPSSDHLIKQFAQVLDLKEEILFYLAGTLPSDINKNLSDADVVAAYTAFRKNPSRS